MTTLPRRIRAALRAAPDGMTVAMLLAALRVDDPRPVAAALRAMPDTYVDRWTRTPRGQVIRVWCVVVPPADCPRPAKR